MVPACGSGLYDMFLLVLHTKYLEALVRSLVLVCGVHVTNEAWEGELVYNCVNKL